MWALLSDGQGSKGHWLVANSKSVSASLSPSANWGIIQLRGSAVMVIRWNCIFKGHGQEGALRWNLTATTKSVALMSCLCFSLGNWLSLCLEKTLLLGNVPVYSSCLASRWPFIRKLEDAESKNLSTNCDALRKSRIESPCPPGHSVSPFLSKALPKWTLGQMGRRKEARAKQTVWARMSGRWGPEPWVAADDATCFLPALFPEVTSICAWSWEIRWRGQVNRAGSSAPSHTWPPDQTKDSTFYFICHRNGLKYELNIQNIIKACRTICSLFKITFES